MLVVGLTGGIASGKSTVANLFAGLSVPIVDADVLARAAVSPGSPGLARVIQQFGEQLLTPQGELDRAQLREKIFNDPQARQQLEAIIHPEVRRSAATALQHLREQQQPYAIQVIPLLFETKQTPSLDRVLVVDCSPEEQLRRLIARDGNDPDLAARILQAQTDRQTRLRLADDIIHNHQSPAELSEQVQTLHQRYLGLAQNQGMT